MNTIKTNKKPIDIWGLAVISLVITLAVAHTLFVVAWSLVNYAEEGAPLAIIVGCSINIIAWYLIFRLFKDGKYKNKPRPLLSWLK